MAKMIEKTNATPKDLLVLSLNPEVKTRMTSRLPRTTFVKKLMMPYMKTKVVHTTPPVRSNEIPIARYEGLLPAVLTMGDMVTLNTNDWTRWKSRITKTHLLSCCERRTRTTSCMRLYSGRISFLIDRGFPVDLQIQRKQIPLPLYRDGHRQP